MPDLSMCRDRGCPSRVGCVRYRAEPWVRQSYFDPPRMGAARCTYYIPTEGVGGFRLRDHALVDLENDGEGK
jgi:hypothetical protein